MMVSEQSEGIRLGLSESAVLLTRINFDPELVIRQTCLSLSSAEIELSQLIQYLVAKDNHAH